MPNPNEVIVSLWDHRKLVWRIFAESPPGIVDTFVEQATKAKVHSLPTTAQSRGHIAKTPAILPAIILS